MPTDTPFRTRELMPNFGVEVLDADVTRETPETMADIVSLFHRHGALLLRGQTMSPAQQVTFTNLFGPPADNPRKEYTVPDYPDVFVISNKVVNGRNIGDPDAGTGWHYDMCYDRYPGLCTILHALEVPPEGSDTLLSDLCAVYEAFPAERRQDLEDMVIHYSYISLQEMKGNVITDLHRATLPDVLHPMIRRHPINGRPALRPCFGGTRGVVGMPNPQGQELLKELVAYATEERFIYRHKWQVGDILVWDNNCTLHKGTPFDKTKHVRHVHRTWVQSPKEHYLDSAYA